ncbi:hypothetical protein F4775DRAFT_561653 [Biscogniauxia sp. FL1348]|nr:hypothetical protein F4775DRAFT_561653 [Biscogniauxia sp. FL1348]
MPRGGGVPQVQVQVPDGRPQSDSPSSSSPPSPPPSIGGIPQSTSWSVAFLKGETQEPPVPSSSSPPSHLSGTAVDRGYPTIDELVGRLPRGGKSKPHHHPTAVDRGNPILDELVGRLLREGRPKHHHPAPPSIGGIPQSTSWWVASFVRGNPRTTDTLLFNTSSTNLRSQRKLPPLLLSPILLLPPSSSPSISSPRRHPLPYLPPLPSAHAPSPSGATRLRSSSSQTPRPHPRSSGAPPSLP